jgi:kinesin family protein 6/9
MIATISPDASQTDESISTCSFAQRVALVKNTATVNEELEPQLVIQRLKAEILKLREEVKFLKGENGDDGNITEDQRYELNRVIKHFLENNDPGAELNIGTITVTKLNETFRLFKLTAFEAQHNHDSEINKENREIIAESKSINKEMEVKKLHHDLIASDEKVDLCLEKNSKPIEKICVQPLKSHSVMRNGDSFDCAKINDDFQSLQHQLIRGVVRCHDINVIGDPAAAFLWFKDRHPGAKAVEENKGLLKEKVFLILFITAFLHLLHSSTLTMKWFSLPFKFMMFSSIQR